MSAVKWVHVNCRISDATIPRTGETLANWIMRRRVFSPNPRPNSLQLPPQCGDNLRAVIGPLFLQDVLANALPDVPVEGGRARIRRPLQEHTAQPRPAPRASRNEDRNRPPSRVGRTSKRPPRVPVGYTATSLRLATGNPADSTDKLIGGHKRVWRYWAKFPVGPPQANRTSTNRGLQGQVAERPMFVDMKQTCPV
jgi:hypothetical protein